MLRDLPSYQKPSSSMRYEVSFFESKRRPITPYVDAKTPKTTFMYVSLKTSALTGHEQGALRGYLPYSKR
jgi:hypothetical protein